MADVCYREWRNRRFRILPLHGWTDLHQDHVPSHSHVCLCKLWATLLVTSIIYVFYQGCPKCHSNHSWCVNFQRHYYVVSSVMWLWHQPFLNPIIPRNRFLSIFIITVGALYFTWVKSLDAPRPSPTPHDIEKEPKGQRA